MPGVKIQTAPIQALQVDGAQAASRARSMHAIGPAAAPKAKIESALPKQSVAGRQAASQARTRHGLGSATEPKAVIQSGMPKQAVDGDQAARRARTMNHMAPSELPDAVEKFTSNMKQMERLATRRRPDPAVSRSTDVSI